MRNNNRIKKFNEHIEDALYKKDALIVIFNKEDDEDYYPIIITHKDKGGNYYGKWKEFQPELIELNIREEGDEWYCESSISRSQLKTKLESRGFNFILGEDY